MDLIYVIRLGRPLFLAGGVVLYALGVVVAQFEGVALHVGALLWGQVAVTAVQLMTHYSNDYFDLAADRANPSPTRWSGGSGMLAEGYLPPRVALAAAVICAGVGVTAVFILAFWVQPGFWGLFLILLALFLAWEYSAPPLRLHSRGLGEVTVALVVAVLTPLAGYTLQAGQPGLLPLLAAWPLAAMQAAMILVINVPDAVGDRRAGKRTLVIRLGAERAARLYVAVVASAYLALPLLVWWGLPPVVAGAVLFTLPVALWQMARMASGAWRDPTRWNSLGFWSVGLVGGTAVAELLAFVWLTFF
jgi:1,4-dihydroxy-2-naphthoate polyprenyltransferase